jgi:hypothetical protein
MPVNITTLLVTAKEFNATRRWNRPGLLKIDDIDSPVREAMIKSQMVQDAITSMMAATGSSREVCEDALMRAHNLGDILTPEELAERLKADVNWVKEKTRARCKNPIPSMPMGRIVRFDWDEVVKWLERQSTAKTEPIKPRRKRIV